MLLLVAVLEGEVRWYLGLGCIGDGHIYPAMSGIPLTGNLNLLEKTTGGLFKDCCLLLLIFLEIPE